METPIGTFQGVTVDTEAPAVGSKAYVAVRPESLHIDSIPAEDNCVSGTIGEATYFGEVAQYEFLADPLKLKVYELNPRAIWGQRQGKLYAWAEPEDVVVLTA